MQIENLLTATATAFTLAVSAAHAIQGPSATDDQAPRAQDVEPHAGPQRAYIVCSLTDTEFRVVFAPNAHPPVAVLECLYKIAEDERQAQ